MGETLYPKHNILWTGDGFLNLRRTDLALEAQELWCAAEKDAEGAKVIRRRKGALRAEEVQLTEGPLARALGKPPGRYVTVDLRRAKLVREEDFDCAATLLAAELRRLMGRGGGPTLVVGLGNADMTPDAVGPLALRHVLPTRHLKDLSISPSLAEVSVLEPGVLGRTGIEAVEIVRGTVERTKPRRVIVIDALATASLERLCTTVQLTDVGIVPGSGVGNARRAFDRKVLGVPVYAVGVPTVVDAATIVRDAAEAAGAADAAVPETFSSVMVTPREIDAEVRTLSRLVGFGVSLALQRQLTLSDLRALGA